jgi:hypothetical protein
VVIIQILCITATCQRECEKNEINTVFLPTVTALLNKESISYKPLKKESTGGLGILLGITGSWRSNPPEDWVFCWESPALGGVIHRRIGYSAGNHQLLEE